MKVISQSKENSLFIKKQPKLLINLLRLFFLICICFVILYPILYMISMSVRTTADMTDPTVIWIPRNFTLENYKQVFELLQYDTRLLNSFGISLLATAINVIICSMVGYGFARFDFKFKNLFFALVIFSIIIPPQTISIPMYMEYSYFSFFGIGDLIGLLTGKALTVNLLDNLLVIILPAFFGIGLRSGLFIYIFRQFFRGIPIELNDAAAIDGCTIPQVFIRIMVPNMSAAFLTCFLFSFVWYWNDYTTIITYFNEPITLSAALSSFSTLLKTTTQTIQMDQYTGTILTQTACLMCIAPLLLIYLFLQRFFMQSIERTGLVG